MTETPTLLLAAPPKEWAACPDWMTFSFARDAEECARRASLRRSEYKNVWEGHGYPPGFSAAAASGVIIHASLGRIARELADDGCGSIQDPRAFEVLKRIGGYSAVLSAEIQRWMVHCDRNPRLRRERLSIHQRLERLVLRCDLLCRICCDAHTLKSRTKTRERSTHHHFKANCITGAISRSNCVTPVCVGKDSQTSWK